MSVTGADFEARREAGKANQRMDDHEKHCSERQIEIRSSLSRLETKFDAGISALTNRLFWMVGMTLTGMGAIIILLLGKTH